MRPTASSFPTMPMHAAKGRIESSGGQFLRGVVQELAKSAELRDGRGEIISYPRVAVGKLRATIRESAVPEQVRQEFDAAGGELLLAARLDSSGDGNVIADGK